MESAILKRFDKYNKMKKSKNGKLKRYKDIFNKNVVDSSNMLCYI